MRIVFKLIVVLAILLSTFWITDTSYANGTYHDMFKISVGK